ncbi:ATP-binding protein, partial [Rhizobium sp. TRM95111]
NLFVVLLVIDPTSHELGSPANPARFTPCLMLLGENAVGKSSILQGIALALIGPSEAKRLKIEPTELLSAENGPRFDQLSPEDAVVRIDFRLSGRSTIFTFDAALRKIQGASGPAGLVLGYGPHRYFGPRRSDRPDTAHARVRSLFSPTAALPFPTTWLNSLDPSSFNEVAKLLRIVRKRQGDPIWRG